MRERQAVYMCTDVLRLLTASDGYVFECAVLSSAITPTQHYYGHAKHLLTFKIMLCFHYEKQNKSHGCKQIILTTTNYC